jgi:hypothetical protein
MQDRTKRRRPARRVEKHLQAGCIEYFRTAVRQGPGAPLLFAIPNGEARDKVTAAQLVGISAERRAMLPDEERLLPFGQGVVPGVYDLQLLLPGGKSVFIDTKRPPNKALKDRGGTLSDQQILFAVRLAELGFHHRIVQSVDEFATVLSEFGVSLRVRWWGPGVGRPGQVVLPPP